MNAKERIKQLSDETLKIEIDHVFQMTKSLERSTDPANQWQYMASMAYWMALKSEETLRVIKDKLVPVSISTDNKVVSFAFKRRKEDG
jgi:hypothetical protein